MIPDLPALLIARLEGERTPLRQIGSSADIDDAERSVKTRPAAFVMPLAERPSAPPLAAEFTQRVEQACGVLLCVSSRSTNTAEDVVPVRRALREALRGWLPDGCADPLAFAGGRLLRLGSGVLWWQDDFVTSYMETL